MRINLTSNSKPFRVRPIYHLLSPRAQFWLLFGLILLIVVVMFQFSRPLKDSLWISSVKETITINMDTNEQPLKDVSVQLQSEAAFTKEEVESGKLDIAQDNIRLLSFIKKNHLTKPPIPKVKVVRTLNVSQNYTIEQEEVEMLVFKLLKNKTNGYFIECGANDGEFYSNTLTLELNSNWSGILIEADPRPFKKLKKMGRNAWLVNACLSTEGIPKKIEMLRNDKGEGLSFIPGLRDFIGNETDYYEFEAQCFPLYSILKAIGRTEIDYFGLDIEGAELAVLKTIPWNSVTIKTLSIEVHPKYAEPVKEYMTQVVGYKFITFLKNGFSHDQIYAHRSLKL